MTLGGERASVQNPFIGYASAVGWECVPPDRAETMQGGAANILFRDVFIRQMMQLNSPFLTRDLAEELAKQVGRIPPRPSKGISLHGNTCGAQRRSMSGQRSGRGMSDSSMRRTSGTTRSR